MIISSVEFGLATLQLIKSEREAGMGALTDAKTDPHPHLVTVNAVILTRNIKPFVGVT